MRTSAAAVVLSAAVIGGCASHDRILHEAASSASAEDIATESAKQMAAAMKANPGTISSEAADLARLMAEMMRHAPSMPGTIGVAGKASPAMAP